MNRMPVLFVGHGTPMNAIEDNKFSGQWRRVGKLLSRPEAVVSVSAHWFTKGTRVLDAPKPKMVYDMYGFPDELYKVEYPAPGSPRFAGLAKQLLAAQVDNTWGLDHGSWSVLRRLFPMADVPIFQISVDRKATAMEHFEMGRKLRELRNQGALILGSGNVVHNLSRVNWSMRGGYPWAEAFDRYIQDNVLRREFENVVHYQNAGASSESAFFLMDHFAPLLYVLGASDENDQITVFNDACTLGSMSMTSYLFA